MQDRPDGRKVGRPRVGELQDAAQVGRGELEPLDPPVAHLLQQQIRGEDRQQHHRVAVEEPLEARGERGHVVQRPSDELALPGLPAGSALQRRRCAPRVVTQRRGRGDHLRQAGATARGRAPAWRIAFWSASCAIARPAMPSPMSPSPGRTCTGPCSRATKSSSRRRSPAGARGSSGRTGSSAASTPSNRTTAAGVFAASTATSRGPAGSPGPARSRSATDLAPSASCCHDSTRSTPSPSAPMTASCPAHPAAISASRAATVAVILAAAAGWIPHRRR